MRHTLQPLGLALSVVLAPTALAQSGAAMMLAPPSPMRVSDEGRPTPWTLELEADAFFTPTEADVTGADVDLSIFDATGRLRLDPDSSYNPTIGFELVQFELGSSDAALPDDLTDVSIAFGGSLGAVDLGESLGGEWQVGYTLGVGYAGTTPFADGDAWYGKADLYAVKPIDRDTRWLVGINYDGNRVFLPDTPLPAVSYFGRLNETTTYALGVPFSRLTWQPDDVWTVDIRSALFFSFNGSVNVQVTEDIKLFAAYVRRADAFTVSGGFDNRRLLFSQELLELGLTSTAIGNIDLTIAAGYAFDQEFDVGYDTRDPGGLRNLDDSVYIRGGLTLGF